MRIGLALLTLIPGKVGGSEIYARGLIDAYRAGAGPDHVTLLVNHQLLAERASLTGGPVSMHRVRSFATGSSTASRTLAVAYGWALAPLAGLDIPSDLDLVHYPVTVPIPRTKAARVVSLHDVQHHELPQFFSRAELLWRRWAYDGAAREADMVMTISEHARERIVERIGVQPERVSVVPLAIDPVRFSPEPADIDGALDLPERFLVYPANLWPHKNHERLLRAFAAVKDPDLVLVLTGATYGRQLPGPSDPRVRHLGYVEHDAVPTLFRRATALIFPSLFEGFGLPILEAMACGCPVAASDDGAVAELGRGAALLFDACDEDAIADAIRRLSSDERLRADLRQRGLERAAGYSWRRTAGLHLPLYEAALARRRTRMPR